MIILTIGNSFSTISGCTVELEKELRELLSYVIGDFFNGFGPKKVSLLSKRGDFPTGLLNNVKSALLGHSFKIIDKRVIPAIQPGLLTSLKIIPYVSQLEAIRQAGLKERGTIVMPTGSGKSLVITLIAAQLGVRTLIVVPTIEIKNQLITTVKSVVKNNITITVENIDSSRLKNLKDFDCLIIDEAHHTAAKTYRDLNRKVWNNIYYRFFFTATPFRSNSDENLLFKSIAGDVIYKLDYKDAVASNYIVPIESYYIELPKQRNDYYTWSEVYKNLIVENTARNQTIGRLLLGLKSAQIYALCLVKEIKHGELLSELTGIEFANGQDKKSSKKIEEFNAGKIKILIGTEGILGEGVDTKPCEYVIIAGLGKAKSSFMQKCGRAVRTYPNKKSAKIIIFKDKSHKFTSRHFETQKKILLEEYDSAVVELFMEEV